MAKEAPEPESVFARRLDQLFRTVHPEDRKPYTPAEVAEAINEAAGERIASPTYMWQLRTGRSDNPTYKVLVGLSRFFGVSPAYFFDETDTARDALPPEVALALKSEAVRELAVDAAELSDGALHAVRQIITSTRVIEDQPQAGTARRGRAKLPPPARHARPRLGERPPTGCLLHSSRNWPRHNSGKGQGRHDRTLTGRKDARRNPMNNSVGNLVPVPLTCHTAHARFHRGTSGQRSGQGQRQCPGSCPADATPREHHGLRVASARGRHSPRG